MGSPTDLAGEIEELLERTLPDKTLVPEMRAARQFIARSHDIEDALAGNAVDARKLGAQIKRKPFSGDLRAAAEFGAQHKRLVAVPGGAQGGNVGMDVLLGLMGGWCRVRRRRPPARAGSWRARATVGASRVRGCAEGDLRTRSPPREQRSREACGARTEDEARRVDERFDKLYQEIVELRETFSLTKQQLEAIQKQFEEFKVTSRVYTKGLWARVTNNKLITFTGKILNSKEGRNFLFQQIKRALGGPEE